MGEYKTTMTDKLGKAKGARRHRLLCLRAWSVWCVAAGGLLLSAGCHSERFAEAQAIRNERIARDYAGCVEREAHRRDSMRTALDQAHESEAWHRKQLKETEQALHDRRIRAVQEWRENSPQRRADYSEGLRGHPEDIPDTFAKMIY
jgi:hypothetical protein